MATIAAALTIAGSDSGGGAGVQADLKTFSALGVYGASVITAVTAQNTQGVTGIHDIPLSMIAAQLDAVATDITFTAVKTGMLSSPEIIDLVSQKIAQYALAPLVVDPVMVAKGGARLLRPDAIDALRELLIPLAAVVTPNLPEAEVLVGFTVDDIESMREAAKRIVNEGAQAVLLKGGHLRGPATDLFYDGHGFIEMPGVRVETKNTHGTGCTLAAAIAAELAKGAPLVAAIQNAKAFITDAITAAYPIGHGHGPVHHFARWWQPTSVEREPSA
ncbi:MAG: bifunctional hydroxymethylpyrimidine kinase/phosphomethylpyrimidine kinase [Dehalococcoidia bacterium]|nr:bifunctional hydroxymethylpyrimidine kinase/phosphomethylpyrimidine kinase [Dehalococcoidia bacterium]